MESSISGGDPGEGKERVPLLAGVIFVRLVDCAGWSLSFCMPEAIEAPRFREGASGVLLCIESSLWTTGGRLSLSALLVAAPRIEKPVELAGFSTV